MILLKKINGTPIALNSDLIEHIEITPDTVITLTSGQKFMVLESTGEIIEKVIKFRKSLFSRELFCPVAVPGVGPACGSPAEGSSSHGR